MLKKISIYTILIGLFTIGSTSVYAQFPNHVKGDVIFKTTVGMPFMAGRKYVKSDGVTFKNSGLALYVQESIDFAVSNHIDIGLFGGYGMETVENYVGDNLFATISSTYIMGGSRFVYHIWGKARWKWDPYVVASLGIASEAFEYSGASSDQFGDPETRLIYALNVGVNYYFTPTFGLHAEGGYGISYGSLGAQLRF